MFTTVGLAVGDRVGVVDRFGVAAVTTVEKRTPTGIVTVAGGRRFKANGNEIGVASYRGASLVDAGVAEARIAAKAAQDKKNAAIYKFCTAAAEFARRKRNGFGDYVGDVTAAEKAELIALIEAI